MSVRYAVYFAPAPDAPLWRWGSRVIGRDAGTDEVLSPPKALQAVAEWPALTSEPRRYGFHGTLKAPFGLVECRDQGDLVAEVENLAERWEAFFIPRLEIALLGSFIALVPAGRSDELAELAVDCVRSLDHLRAPTSAADRQRRMGANLSNKQVSYLDAWGYPYVFDEFRFHLTLTGPLPAESREHILDVLRASYAELKPGLLVDGVTIFRQDDRASPFRILRRLPFAAATVRTSSPAERRGPA